MVFSTPQFEKRRFRIAHIFNGQWLAAIENDGTSLYRSQPAEKRCFSTGC